jgi:HD-GYP domain-containing protein (c-di-GMP phosphodiesterase class II)
VSSSNTKTTQSHLQKCIEFDKKLVQLYEEALEIYSENEVLKHQNDKIAQVIEENIHFLENTGFVLES